MTVAARAIVAETVCRDSGELRGILCQAFWWPGWFRLPRHVRPRNQSQLVSLLHLMRTMDLARYSCLAAFWDYSFRCRSGLP